MKIGILTFHRAHNYGAVLQCYALQEFLSKLGHDVEVIDYRQPVLEKLYRVISLKGVIYHLIHISTLLDYIKNSYDRYKKTKLYRPFVRKHLRVMNTFYDSRHVPNSYDVYVMGSDQLLSVGIIHGIDDVYTGNFNLSNGKRKVAYAISTNSKSIDIIGEGRLRQIINNFDYFSFREKSITDIVNVRLQSNVKTCVDPTVLSDESYWTPLLENVTISKKYVVFYQVRYPLNDQNAVCNKAKELARNLDLDFVDISKGCTVGEWLSYIKHSECVVTSSFHATVFSLLFKKPLYALSLGDGADGRYVDLLRTLGMDNCIKQIDEHLLSIPNVPSDLDSRMNAIKIESETFIINSLA